MSKAKVTTTDGLKMTTDYSLFVKDANNRDLDIDGHRWLGESMRVHGFLRQHPIAVRKDATGKYKVKCGQHRLYFAEKLGLPVYFVEQEKELDSVELEGTEKKWKPADRARNWANRGVQSYRELLEFADRTNIPLGMAAAICMGTYSYGNIQSQFESGQFEMRDREHAEMVSQVYVAFSTFDKRIAGTLFIKAIGAAARVKHFDHLRLLKNMRKCPELLKRYATREAFLEMLEEIYNYRQPNRVPLKFEAVQAMHERNIVTRNAKLKSDEAA